MRPRAFVRQAIAAEKHRDSQSNFELRGPQMLKFVVAFLFGVILFVTDLGWMQVKSADACCGPGHKSMQE